ncbi:hypothetical protein [Mucilaginibacter sp. OK098]|uniref:hypothetical protein n=1 Tax=Mucilaginibacter sp. OK098 TaxID=1855297 RepID=UPI0011611F05|nr:hypothetical protein [Mucilaginibacter sp. OK098]
MADDVGQGIANNVLRVKVLERPDRQASLPNAQKLKERKIAVFKIYILHIGPLTNQIFQCIVPLVLGSHAVNRYNFLHEDLG